jgi:hypothetical protein
MIIYHVSYRWKAYRFQPHVVISEEEMKRIKDAKAAAFRKTLQTPLYKDEEDDMASSKKTTSVTPTKSMFAMPQWGSPFGSSSPVISSSTTTTSGTTSSHPKDLEELIKLRDMSISPQPATKTFKSSTQASSSSSSESNTGNIPTKSPKSSSSISSATKDIEQEEYTFEEAYIEFDKEPEVASYSGEYETQDKKKMAKVASGESLSEGTEGTWAGEGYESSVSSKDKPFHKYHKRLQRSPEQCLRYWRGAEPLYSSANMPKQVPNCNHCGAKRVAETQLTPALIYLLKCTNDKQESNLEFGTIIVYTCAANCTIEDEPLHQEHIELQKGM